MIEKFSDFESTKYLANEGTFEFEVTGYELKDSTKGDPMAVLTVKSDAGQTTIYHSLVPKARWSYNNLIKACLCLSEEEAKTFELDYQTIGNQLIGKHFVATVYQDSYDKIEKVLNDYGGYDEKTVTKTSYKIDTKSYTPAG